MSRLLLLALALLALPLQASELTIERIFSDPDLNGPSPRGLQLAPDGRRVTYLRGREDDQNQLDLWEYGIQSRRSRRLVDSRALSTGAALSEDEKARRERARTAQYRGVLDYQWSPDSRFLLFRVDGRLWLLEPGAKAPPRALTEAGQDVAEARVSPRGHWVSYVSGQNLHVIDLASGEHRALTGDGGGPVFNGEAEFIAQEEMDRRQGYWWAPDDSAIAFQQHDESGVDQVERSEIHAGGTLTRTQRYPGAGRPNVRVRLGLVAPTGGAVRWVDLGPDPDIYLARVAWQPDSGRLVFQRQDRSQRRLDLVAIDARTLQPQRLLTETSDTWLHLHDDLRFLSGRQGFIWASERSGYKHLYLHDSQGRRLHALTAGEWDVDALLAVDEARGVVWFAGNPGDPLGKQVYTARLDGRDAGAPVRISAGDGWHEAVFGATAEVWIDTWSSPAHPPKVALRDRNGRHLAWIEENALVEGHPYWPYSKDHLAAEFGTLQGPSGEALHYRLTRPQGFDASRRWPVFVTYYGGPGRQYVSRSWGNHFEQYMARQGYVVFALDNRGTPRRGRAFADAIHRHMGKAEIEDQLAGLAWLRAQPWVDGGRIGAFGWSYGGYQTLKLLAADPQLAAGAAVAPVTDWSLYDTHYTERFLGTPRDNAAGYAASGIFGEVDRLGSGRLLLVHGMADDNVLFAHSTRLMAALQENGQQFRLMTYPGGKHGLSTPALRRHVHTLVSAFMDERLKAQ